MVDWIRHHAIYLAWTIALLAAGGSLYFSEVLLLPPCVLCWYQRAFMYPLVVVLGTGLLRRDTQVRIYALPLALFGLLIAVYHNLLYYGLIPESIAPCTTGISCVTTQLNLFGFITIPLLSLVGFVFISAALLLHKPNQGENHDQRT